MVKEESQPPVDLRLSDLELRRVNRGIGPRSEVEAVRSRVVSCRLEIEDIAACSAERRIIAEVEVRVRVA